MSETYVFLPLVAVGALACGYFVVRYDLRRRRVSASAVMVALTFLALSGAGAMGAEFLRDVAAAGGVLGLLVAALLLARTYRLPVLLLLDVGATALTLVVAACHLLVSVSFRSLQQVGERDFGIAGVIVFAWLWGEGRRSIQWQRPRGVVFGEYLVLSGLLGLLQYPYFWRFGFRPWHIAALGTALGGAILLVIIVPRFVRTREEHRIMADVSATGESLQPEYTPATPECPHPELWKMYDSMSAEAEVLDFLKQLVITIKPNLVVETGTFMGVSTLAIAQGLKQNGFGRVITVEFDPKVFAKAKERIDASGLAAWIDARNQSSLDLKVDGSIDLLFSDSDINIREREVRHLLPAISPYGLILIHDASSHQKVVREAALRLEAEGLISVVLVPTPRGLVVAQKRAGCR